MEFVRGFTKLCMGRRKSNDVAAKFVVAIVGAVLAIVLAIFSRLSVKGRVALISLILFAGLVLRLVENSASTYYPTASEALRASPVLVASSENSPAEAIPFRAAWISVPVVNQRAKPNGTVIGKLKLGTAVKVYHELEGWVRISPLDADSSWVSKRLVCFTRGCAQPTVKINATPANSSASLSNSGFRSASASITRSTANTITSACWCSGNKVCIGPRGGVYCITSGGNKRYLPR